MRFKLEFLTETQTEMHWTTIFAETGSNQPAFQQFARVQY